MENYTNPGQEGQEQNQQDLINASLIFARALGLIFRDDEGIVVDVKGDVNLGTPPIEGEELTEPEQ